MYVYLYEKIEFLNNMKYILTDSSYLRNVEKLQNFFNYYYYSFVKLERPLIGSKFVTLNFAMLKYESEHMPEILIK